MKKLLLFLIIPFVFLGQVEELCDSVSASFVEYSISGNTVEIAVNTTYSGSYWFPYAGFMLTNNNGDTIAIESLSSAGNVYGLGGGMSEMRSLEIIGNFAPPGNATIHLVNYLFAGNAAIVCSWPFDYTNVFTSVPDDNFEQVLINLGYDDTMDDYVLTSSINNIQYIDLSYNPIADLTGIEDFSALETLVCSGMLLSELDVSNNSELAVLECSFNNLNTLDVSNNTNINTLNCSGNNLSELDVSNNLNLSHLDCADNSLSQLNVSNNLELELLWCDFNNLNELDVSNNSELYYLFCHDNNLSQLSLLNNTNLYYLFCENNDFSCVEIWDPTYAEENEYFINGEDVSWSLDCDYENETPFNGIVVEEIDNNNFVDGQTYRIYAKINEGKLTGYWANENNSSYIQTSSTFYVDEANLWGNLPGEVENKKIQRGIDEELLDAIPSSQYTSWLTLGDSYSAGTNICPYNAVFHKSDNFELGAGVTNSTYLLNYNGTEGESGFVRLSETNYTFINSNYLYYSSAQNIGWFPYGGNPSGLIQGDYCESSVSYPDENDLVLLFQMTTNGTICGLINLEGVDENGNYWAEGGIDILIANGNTTDCDGDCITDLDEDLICDEVDDCVGEYDECNVCNGNGPELYYDCDWNCLSDTDGDGWCDELEIEGCDDINSCNYNPLSTDILCVYPELYYDCDGNCITDLDDDLICDEVDDCVGEYDECNVCNGSGPEEGADCDGNCIDGYTQLTLIWTGGLNATFSVSGEINGLLYTSELTTETGYLAECWLTDLQTDCFTINIEGGDELAWELYSGNLLILEGSSENVFFGSQCMTGCTDPLACAGFNLDAVIDDGSCIYPGGECVTWGAYGESMIGVYDDNCECIQNMFSINEFNRNSKIIAIVDALGREVNNEKNSSVLFYIFNDGSIEKIYTLK